MDFVKRSSIYVEAVKFEGTEESVIDLISLMNQIYDVYDLGIYEKQITIEVAGKPVKITTAFANFLTIHKEKNKKELISVPKNHYLVLTKLGLKTVNPITFESEYKEV